MHPHRCLAFASLLALIGLGCGSNNHCTDPNGRDCAKSNFFPQDDPRSICHVCCEADSNRTDATAEISQPAVGSAFTAHVLQRRFIYFERNFLNVGAAWTPFLFDNKGGFTFQDNSSGLMFNLITRGRSHEGNLTVSDPFGFVVGPTILNCNIARN